MQSMRTLVLVCMLLFQSTGLFSQESGGGTITGQVVDKSTDRALQFVNVFLQRTIDSTVVTGTVSGKRGTFDLANINSGDYFLRFSLIGYTEKRLNPFSIDA